MRPLGGNAEDIGRHLHDAVALRPAARNLEPPDLHAIAPFQPRRRLAQRIGDAFDDGPVHMRPVMHIAETDHRALGLWPWKSDARDSRRAAR